MVTITGYKEGVEISVRRVVRGSEQLGRSISKLRELFGQGDEVDVFEETLVLKPKQETGNMNFLHRESVVSIQYTSGSSNGVLVKQIGSLVPTPGGGKDSQAATVRVSPCSNCNIRRVFMKAGFRAKNDFAKKGLSFQTRNGATVIVSRPYNAKLSPESSFNTGRATWDTLAGNLPFGQDYLLEISHIVGAQGEVPTAVARIEQLLHRINS